MKSSAKVTVSIIAAMALGAVGFACTIGSGTVSDVDGGTSTSSSSSSSSSSGSTSDAGDAGPPICEPVSGDVQFQPTACDTCLRTNCPCETAGCFNTPDEPVDGGKQGCASYSECLVSCDDANPGDVAKANECKDFCEGAAFPTIPASFVNFQNCRDQKCATDCPN